MDQSGTLFAALDAQEALAQTLARQHEPGRARTVLEGVLDARRRQQGSEHGGTRVLERRRVSVVFWPLLLLLRRLSIR